MKYYLLTSNFIQSHTRYTHNYIAVYCVASISVILLLFININIAIITSITVILLNVSVRYTQTPLYVHIIPFSRYSFLCIYFNFFCFNFLIRIYTKFVLLFILTFCKGCKYLHISSKLSTLSFLLLESSLYPARFFKHIHYQKSIAVYSVNLINCCFTSLGALSYVFVPLP